MVLRFISYPIFFLLMSCTALSSQVFVFAGNDTLICSNSQLLLDDLNASISGSLNTGNWFTYGDGVFTPGSNSTLPFGITGSYVPGPQDIANGSFTLVLASDDPDGPGPLLQGLDEIVVAFSSDPPMLCNGSINVSLDQNCEQLLDLALVFNNITGLPSNLFRVSLFDSQGIELATPLLTTQHIGLSLDYKVSFTCSGNSCWGTVTVNDYLPPSFACSDVTVSCINSIDPSDIGFPFGPDAVIIQQTNNQLVVEGLDACSLSDVSYTDSNFDYDCSSSQYEQRITRSWVATDAEGNSSSCIQQIYTLKLDINSVALPLNRDDIDLPALECGSNFTLNPAGLPDPSESGYPEIGFCIDINASYQDFLSEECGSTYKVFRSWKIINWCNGQSIDYNQIVKVKDSTAPTFDCPVDRTISTSYTSCQSDPFNITILNSFDGCGDMDLTYNIQTVSGLSMYQGAANGLEINIMPLELGSYIVDVIATDDCGNTDNCMFNITVEDQVNPYAICNQFLKASINVDGTARVYANSLDNLSFDLCSDVSFEIKKEADICGFGTSYGEFVEFCCAEIGSKIPVSLRVTDASGNQLECWAEIEVEDKLSPELVCLPDLTISCETTIDTSDLSSFGTIVNDQLLREPIVINDFYNSGQVGLDGYFLDNCIATISESYTYQIDCGEGSLTRTFLVADNLSNTQSCIQNITIRNPYTFGEQDIIWPRNRSTNSCDVDFLDIDEWGSPEYLMVDCMGLVESSFLDQTFTQVDSSCSKILREWTVIDWCQFDPITGAGLFHYTQILKQENLVAPSVLTSSCVDTTVCILDACDVNYTYQLLAEDDCTDVDDLIFSWELKTASGLLLDNGNSFLVDNNLEVGTYSISWLVEDKCGNLTDCVQNIEVVDCKKPSPYCHSNITVALSGPGAEIDIWANDFDLGSFDNCDEKNALIFSFEESNLVSSLTFDCNDIINGISQHVLLEMWVWDTSGNKDFCEITLTIQDNSDDCLDNINGVNVNGVISSIYDYKPEETIINFLTDISSYESSVSIDSQGAYTSDSLVNGMYYEVVPYNDNDIALGVSALDIFVTRKHVLGLVPITRPEDRIAADVNNSGSISSIDIFQMQKLILGKQDSFANNTSWRFIPSDYIILDSITPFEFPESKVVATNYESIDSLDFKAIKIGDVNGTLKDNLQGGQVESRSILQLKATKRTRDNRYFIDIYKPEGLENIDAMQFSVLGIPNVTNINSTFDNVSFDLAGEKLNVLAYNDGDKSLYREEILFTIELSKEIFDLEKLEISQVNRYLESAIYINGETVFIDDIIFENIDKDLSKTGKVYPNPTSGLVYIDLAFIVDQKAIITIYNAAGAAVFYEEYSKEISPQIIEFDLSNSGDKGLYFVEILSESNRKIEKLILF